MTKIITDLQAADIDVHLTEQGKFAILSLITAQGPVSVHMQRRAFDALAARMKRELEREAATALPEEPEQEGHP